MRSVNSFATSTIFRYCGAGNKLSSADDIVAQYYFDHWGHPVNIDTYDVDANNVNFDSKDLPGCGDFAATR